jgi:uncharacterized protein with NAD-binding domain and iron-sulfur cluster
VAAPQDEVPDAEGAIMSSQMNVAIIGAGPAGLMAAETLALGGARVTVYDAMSSVGRKFLMAGRGGLNLTHSEPLPAFLTRYREAMPQLAAAIQAFLPDYLRAWCEALGQPTFVGSSGRRRLGGDPWRERREGIAAQTRQLRVHRRLVGHLPRSLRRPTAEGDRVVVRST